MDKNEASPTVGEPTKSRGRVALFCAPVAARWDAEAARRRELRTPENLAALKDAKQAHNEARLKYTKAQAKAQAAASSHKNPGSAARRAARAEARAAKQELKQARGMLRAAQLRYPPTLFRRAVQVHTPHTLIAAVGSLAVSAPWPVLTSAGFIVANALPVIVGRRALLTVAVDDGLSEEERQLMGRLQPHHWVRHAADRGLEGTVTTPPEMTPGGIRCDVRLDGRWTPRTLAERADSIRALLGARTGVRMRITAGPRGDWAVISLATRRATNGTSVLWTPDTIPADPGLMSLGLDTETGDPVTALFDERLLVSGASGTGKSWSLRPLMATAHLRGDFVLIDGKGEEANVWESVCRTAVEPDEIADVIDAAHAEMGRRKRAMKERGLSVWDGRQLTLLVDEGQVILAFVMRDKARLQRLIELSSLGRSRGVVLWWATQYPVTEGGAPGVHKMIAPNLLTRFSLRVAGTTQAQVALDDCAHYAPHQIPDGREWRGHGYLKGYGPRLIQTWTLDDDGVRGLPARHWRSDAPAVMPAESVAPSEPFAFPGVRPALRLVKGGAAPADDHDQEEAELPAVPTTQAREEEPVTNRSRVLDAVRSGAQTQADVRDRTGLNKGTVSREIKALIASGDVHKGEDGMLRATGKEASA